MPASRFHGFFHTAIDFRFQPSHQVATSSIRASDYEHPLLVTLSSPTTTSRPCRNLTSLQPTLWGMSVPAGKRDIHLPAPLPQPARRIYREPLRPPCPRSIPPPRKPFIHFTEGIGAEITIERLKPSPRLMLQTPLRPCLPSLTGMLIDPRLEANLPTYINTSQLESPEAPTLRNEPHREPIRQHHGRTAPCPHHLQPGRAARPGGEYGRTPGPHCTSAPMRASPLRPSSHESSDNSVPFPGAWHQQPGQ